TSGTAVRPCEYQPPRASFMRKPELNVNARWLRVTVGTSAYRYQPEPPGSWVPAKSAARTSFVSIQSKPATRLVWTVSGRRNATSPVGRPWTFGPTGCHVPSCGRGLATSGRTFAGSGRWAGGAGFGGWLRGLGRVPGPPAGCPVPEGVG